MANQDDLAMFPDATDVSMTKLSLAELPAQTETKSAWGDYSSGSEDEVTWTYEEICGLFLDYGNPNLSEAWVKMDPAARDGIIKHLDDADITDADKVIDYVKGYLLKRDQPARRPTAAVASVDLELLRTKCHVSRLIYLNAAPMAWTTRPPTFAEYPKYQSQIMAECTDAAQLAREWQPAEALEHLLWLQSNNVNPELVRSSLAKPLDTAVVYVSAFFWHILSSVEGWSLTEKGLESPSGELIVVTDDPVGYGYGWIKTPGELESALAGAIAASVTVLPGSHRAMQLLTYLLSMYRFKRLGVFFTFEPLSGSGVSTLFHSRPAYRKAIGDKLKTWLEANPVPPNLGATSMFTTYLHLVVEYALRGPLADKLAWPLENACISWAKKRMNKSFSKNLQPWVPYKDLAALFSAVGKKTAPVSGLKSCLAKLSDRRNEQNKNSTLNNAYANSDVGIDGLRSKMTANTEIARAVLIGAGCPKVVADVIGAGQTPDVVVFGLDDLSWLTALSKVLPNITLRKFHTTKSKLADAWDLSRGYPPSTANTLLIDQTYGLGTNIYDGNSKKLSAIMSSSASNLLIRFTLDSDCAFGGSKFKDPKTGLDKVKYVLPYGIEQMVPLFAETKAFAPGRAHCPEFWVMFKRRLSTSDDPCDVDVNTKRVFDTINAKLFLMDIANSFRAAAWEAGYIGAFGPRVFDYISTPVWDYIVNATGFSCVPRMPSLSLDSIIKFSGPPEDEGPGLAFIADSTSAPEKALEEGPTAFSAKRGKDVFGSATPMELTKDKRKADGDIRRTTKQRKAGTPPHSDGGHKQHHKGKGKSKEYSRSDREKKAD